MTQKIVSDQQVADKLALIKGSMPNVYLSVKAKSAERPGAFALVRRGLRGEANCFYAFERGHVVGTPFALPGINADVASAMVQFGCAHVCIWALPAEVSSGAH